MNDTELRELLDWRKRVDDSNDLEALQREADHLRAVDRRGLNQEQRHRLDDAAFRLDRILELVERM